MDEEIIITKEETPIEENKNIFDKLEKFLKRSKELDSNYFKNKPMAYSFLKIFIIIPFAIYLLAILLLLPIHNEVITIFITAFLCLVLNSLIPFLLLYGERHISFFNKISSVLNKLSHIEENIFKNKKLYELYALNKCFYKKRPIIYSVISTIFALSIMGLMCIPIIFLVSLLIHLNFFILITLLAISFVFVVLELSVSFLMGLTYKTICRNITDDNNKS